MSDKDNNNSTFDAEFNFDEWVTLYKEDPKKFEYKRKQWIDDAIKAASTEQQQRLQGLQFQVDAIRRTCSNPYQSTLKITVLMMDALSNLNDALHGEVPEAHKAHDESAKVLRLSKKQEKPDY